METGAGVIRIWNGVSPVLMFPLWYSVEIMVSGPGAFPVPSVVVFLALQRRLVGGLSTGAIK